jgi:predicted GNAT superfamily acetyltransferase
MAELRFLTKPEEFEQVEALQRLIWPGNETEIVPVHILRTVADHGGVLIGAYKESVLVGFVFGFPGLERIGDFPEQSHLMHASHMVGINPDFRDSGLGFDLKRAQWQAVRQQKIDHISWTYDPMQSRNASLNISKLGAVCNTYSEDHYGEMRDNINAGLPSDRFIVDWWINTTRVQNRLDRNRRGRLSLDHYQDAKARIINPVQQWVDQFPVPADEINDFSAQKLPIVLVEIPTDFQNMTAGNQELALGWRIQSRQIFKAYFLERYIVTDFVFKAGEPSRGYYVLSHGDSSF